MKKILLLGAGLVTRPLVNYLLNDEGIQLNVGSRTVSKAQALVGKHPRGNAFALNVDNAAELEAAVAANDLTISLVPYTYHVAIAKFCIKHKKDMVTTSYVSPAMAALDKDCKKAGILILNEIGLDPGIDHMSAMKIVHKVAKKGGKVVSFKSYCGGLPAPEANDNPLGYKFSWSPRGVLMAGRNQGKYLLDGRTVEIPNPWLFADHHIVEVPGLGHLEAYPNRDSVQYKAIYNLKNAKTIFRGTFRNLGWCDMLMKMVQLNMFAMEDVDFSGMTYRDYMCSLIGCTEKCSEEGIRKALAETLNISTKHEILDKLAWIGLFEDKPVTPARNTRLDLLLGILQPKLELKASERDMCVMHHEFIAEYPKTKKREKITSTLLAFGDPNGDTSMAKTVSLPAAIATRLMLKKKIKKTGVHIPVDPLIYEPVLKEMEKATGLKFVEQTTKL
jgi:saccharopine dehydrogenase (NADP+, L-glutamate forming)